MSSKKLEKLNLVSVIDRLKSELSFKENKEIAELIGISASSFSQKLKTGTIVKDLFLWAYLENINLNWLFYGLGTAKVFLNDNTYIEDVTQLNELYSELRNFYERDDTGFLKLKDHIKSFISGRDSLRDEIEDSKAG